MNDSDFIEMVWLYLDGALKDDEQVQFHRELTADARRVHTFNHLRFKAGLVVAHEGHPVRDQRQAA